jgi:hypothetical protein
MAMLGLFLSGLAGCDGGTPPDGSRAIVAADYLEQQRAKLDKFRRSQKIWPQPRQAARR